MNNEILGSQLVAEDQQFVLLTYVHRFTKEHKPLWARQPRPDGSAYKVQFASDADWLSHTHFAVRKDGRLDERAHFCTSSPTWPDNPELRKS